MLYPQTPIPDVPITVEKEHNTLISQLKNGIEYRRRIRFRERRAIGLSYRYRHREDLQGIYNFYSQRGGNYESFIFEFPYEDTYLNEYVGRGDSATTIFTLPFKTYTSLTVYIDGNIVNPTDYTINTSGERATITFTTAPPSNTLITCNFSGRARLKVRFNDNIQISYNRAGLADMQVSLIEVLD